MSRRSLLLKSLGVLSAALLLTAAPALAGDRVRAANHLTYPSKPAAPVVARAGTPVTIQIAVATVAEPAAAAAVIKLRGPDGQVRSFPVEGGTEGLASRIIILRPGESITLRLSTK